MIFTGASPPSAVLKKAWKAKKYWGGDNLEPILERYARETAAYFPHRTTPTQWVACLRVILVHAMQFIQMVINAMARQSASDTAAMQQKWTTLGRHGIQWLVLFKVKMKHAYFRRLVYTLHSFQEPMDDAIDAAHQIFKAARLQVQEQFLVCPARCLLRLPKHLPFQAALSASDLQHLVTCSRHSHDLWCPHFVDKGTNKWRRSSPHTVDPILATMMSQTQAIGADLQAAGDPTTLYRDDEKQPIEQQAGLHNNPNPAIISNSFSRSSSRRQPISQRLTADPAAAASHQVQLNARHTTPPPSSRRNRSSATAAPAPNSVNPPNQPPAYLQSAPHSDAQRHPPNAAPMHGRPVRHVAANNRFLHLCVASRDSAASPIISNVLAVAGGAKELTIAALGALDPTDPARSNTLRMQQAINMANGPSVDHLEGLYTLYVCPCPFLLMRYFSLFPLSLVCCLSLSYPSLPGFPVVPTQNYLVPQTGNPVCYVLCFVLGLSVVPSTKTPHRYTYLSCDVSQMHLIATNSLVLRS